MSRREKIIDSTPETTGIAEALAVLIEKNQSQARELEALARLIQTEIVAAEQREAEQAARLGEALVELAEAVTAAEIEKTKRIEAEERAAELTTAIDQIEVILASIRTTAKLIPRGSMTPVTDAVATDDDAPIVREAPKAAISADVGSMDEAERAGPADHGRDRLPAEATAARKVRITIEFDEEEAWELEDTAVGDGFLDATAYMKHLARQAIGPKEGCRRTGIAVVATGPGPLEEPLPRCPPGSRPRGHP